MRRTSVFHVVISVVPSVSDRRDFNVEWERPDPHFPLGPGLERRDVPEGEIENRATIFYVDYTVFVNISLSQLMNIKFASTLIN